MMQSETFGSSVEKSSELTELHELKLSVSFQLFKLPNHINSVCVSLKTNV